MMKTLLLLLVSALCVLLDVVQAGSTRYLAQKTAGCLTGRLEESPHFRIRKEVDQFAKMTHDTLLAKYESRNNPFNTLRFLEDIKTLDENSVKDLLFKRRILYIYATRILITCILRRDLGAWKVMTSSTKFFNTSLKNAPVDFKSFLAFELDNETNADKREILKQMDKAFENPVVRDAIVETDKVKNYLIGLASVMNWNELQTVAIRLKKDLRTTVFANGDYIIHLAVRFNNLELLRNLLKLDASFNPTDGEELIDVNITTEAKDPFFRGLTPLILATLLDRKQAFELIMKHPLALTTLTTSSGLNVKRIINQMSVENQETYNEYLKEMSNADRIVYSVWVATCYGDSYAEAIMNNRSDACFEAFRWAGKSIFTADILSAIGFKDRRDLIEPEPRTEFTREMESLSAAFLEAVAMLPNSSQELWHDLFSIKLATFFSANNQSAPHAEYFPTIQELMFIRRLSPTLIEKYFKTTVILNDTRMAQLLMEQTLARYDSDLILRFSNVDRMFVRNYTDRRTNEPISHILIRDFYPVTRDLDLLKELKNVVNWTSQYPVMDRTPFFTFENHFYPSKIMSKVYVRYSLLFYLSFTEKAPEHTVTVRGQASIPTSNYKTIAYYIAGRENWQDLEKAFKDILALNPEWKKINAEMDEKIKIIPSYQDYEKNYWHWQPAKFDEGSLENGDGNDEYFFNTYLTIQNSHLNGRYYENKFFEKIHYIDEKFSIGPEQNSVFHIIVSPKASFRDKHLFDTNFLVYLIDHFVLGRQKFYVDHVARVGEAFTYTDLKGTIITTTTQNMTALQIAVARRKWHLVEALINNKADIYKTFKKEQSMARIYLRYLYTQRHEPIAKIK